MPWRPRPSGSTDGLRDHQTIRTGVFSPKTRAMPMPKPLRLVLLSCLMLFVELALIRWTGSNIVYLSYFSNFVLLGSFLGIGVGFLRGRAATDLFPYAPVALALFVGLVLLFPVQVDRSGSDERGPVRALVRDHLVCHALVFAGVLLSVLAAIEVARRWRPANPAWLYGALLAAVGMAWLVPVGFLLSLEMVPRFGLAVLVWFTPIFIANLVLPSASATWRPRMWPSARTCWAPWSAACSSTRPWSPATRRSSSWWRSSTAQPSWSGGCTCGKVHDNP